MHDGRGLPATPIPGIQDAPPLQARVLSGDPGSRGGALGPARPRPESGSPKTHLGHWRVDAGEERRIGSDGQSGAVSRPSLSGPANQAQGALLKVQRRVPGAERCEEAVSDISVWPRAVRMVGGSGKKTPTFLELRKVPRASPFEPRGLQFPRGVIEGVPKTTDCHGEKRTEMAQQTPGSLAETSPKKDCAAT